MSTLSRLFVDTDLATGLRHELAQSQAHYLRDVMRLKPGAAVRVFNGRDGEWRADVSDVTKRAVTLTITDRLRVQPETAPGPSLLFAPLKKTRTDFAIEKATELGASMICPVTTARTQTARIKPERLEALAMEAAEQTERLDVPGVADLVPLDQALDDWPADNVLIFCDEAGDDDGAPWGGAAGRALPMQSVLADLPAETRGGVLIGPEGGFSADERKTLRSKSFVRPVTLGPRILRAETAVVSALTIWQSVLGDWR